MCRNERGFGEEFGIHGDQYLVVVLVSFVMVRSQASTVPHVSETWFFPVVVDESIDERITCSRVVGKVVVGKRRAHNLNEPGEVSVDESIDNGIAVIEVRVERTRRHLGACGDRYGRQRVEAIFVNQFRSRVDNRVKPLP